MSFLSSLGVGGGHWDRFLSKGSEQWHCTHQWGAGSQISGLPGIPKGSVWCSPRSYGYIISTEYLMLPVHTHTPLALEEG